MNVLVITVDALRSDHLGYMRGNRYNPLSNSAVPSTPNIDNLADKSLRFVSMFATGGHTRMSFPSIMTGLYPPKTPLSPIYSGSSKQNNKTIAEVFSDSGYNTAGFHSNPFLSTGTGFEKGFDVFKDNQHSRRRLETIVRSKIQKYSKGTPVYKILRQVYLQYRSALSTNIGLPYIPAEKLSQQVIAWSESVSEHFFCWCHFMDPHAPYQPHQNTDSYHIPVKKALNLYNKIDLNKKSSEFTEDELQLIKELYKGEVEYVDKYIGKLLDHFRSLSLSSDLLVILVADHGEELGEYGKMAHGDRFYDPNIHTPCLFSWEASTKSPKTINTVSSTVDILPTAASIASVEYQMGDGRAIQNQNDTNMKSRFVYSHGSNNKVMTTDGVYKLIKDISENSYVLRSREDPYLDKNPTQIDHDSSISKEYLDNMVVELDNYIQNNEIGGNTNSNQDLPSHVQHQLDALGYRE